jgi:hypothetical protein
MDWAVAVQSKISPAKKEGGSRHGDPKSEIENAVLAAPPVRPEAVTGVTATRSATTYPLAYAVADAAVFG